MIDSYSRSWDAVERPVQHKRSGGSFWRMEEPVIRQTLEGPEVIKGGMFQHQRDWWRSARFVAGLVTGYGGGKSLTLYKRAIASAIENAPVPVVICMPSYPMAKTITIPAMGELLDGKVSIYGRRAFDWDFNATAPMRYRIRFRGREGTIWVLSSENPKTLVGPNLAAVYMDEPFIQPYAAFDKLQTRVRHPMAKVREIRLAGTPEQLNWGYDLFKGKLAESFDTHLVQASTQANLALGPEYAERLLSGYDSDTAAAYVGGEFRNLSKGRIYFGYDEDRNVVPDEQVALPQGVLMYKGPHGFTLPVGSKLGLGIDFNVDPMAFVVFWYTDYHLHYLWEQEIPNADTDYACQIVREKFGGPNVLEDCYPDPACTQRNTAASGRTDGKILVARGFHLFHRRKHPTRRDRYNATNAGLRPAVNPHLPRVTISPRCKRLQLCLGEYTAKNMNTDDGKRMSHILDAATYAPELLFGLERATVHSRKVAM